jgi:spermidine/putrescine-binding protein
MKRFLLLTAIIFGFLLSYQILKIASQRKHMADINLTESKGKTLHIIGPDFFSERNIYESFNKRYEAKLKFKLKNSPEDFKTDELTSNIVIYPSFLYQKIYDSGKIIPIDINKAKNIDNLMDNFLLLTKKNYSKNNSFLAIPVGYMPYAIFFNISRVNKTTKGRELINEKYKIALADDYGSLLTIIKIFNLKPDKNGIEQINKILKQKPIFFNVENPSIGLTTLIKEKPDVIVAPSYLRGFFEREIGSLESILPDEGTYTTLYLISIINDNNDNTLSYVFINHMLDPIIHKNLTDIMGLGITNKTSLTSISAVYYNFLKMNYPEYLNNMYILKTEEEYLLAKNLFQDFKKR